MSRIISELLGAKEPGFSLMIRRLEKSANRPAADIRLAAEIEQKVRAKSRELGLDPDDSSPNELYSALRELATLHDDHLRRALGVDESSNTQDVLKKIAITAQKLRIPKSVWVLKSAAAKRFLTKIPPKNLMKMLGYRSLDSMLKRGNIAEIYIGAQICESLLWKKRFAAELKKCQPHDFESREVEVIVLDPKKWNIAAHNYSVQNRHNVALSHELGVVALLPLPKTDTKGLVLTILPLVLEMINEIRIQSAYLKMRQVKPGFGKSVSAVFQKEANSLTQLDGMALPWRLVHRHFSSRSKASYGEVFEPHIQAEDLLLKKAEESLYYLEPSLAFWRDLDFVGVVTSGKPVSFSLIDMAINSMNNAPFGKQSVSHLRNSLWNKLLSLYMSQPSIEDDILNQLDESLNGSTLSLGTLRGVAV